MTVDSVTSPELLAAELAAIEDLLQNYEDWRAWAQLEARERQGELPPAVAASGLKTLLLDKLANNTLFLRRQALVKQLEHVTAQSRTRPRAADEADDLTRIRGIDVRLERRLNNLAVRSWHQIAHWTPADVHYFASTLGLGDSIARDAWIEQAAALSGLAPRAPAAAPVAHQPPPQAPAVPVAQLAPVALPPQAVAAAPAVPLPDPEIAEPAAAPTPRRAAVADPETPPAAVTPVQPGPAKQDAKPQQRATPAQPASGEAAPTAAVAAPAPAPTPVATEKGPAAPQPEAVQVREEPVTEPDYQLAAPALPLPASVYAGYVPKPPSAPPLERTVGPLKTAALAAAAAPPHAPEPAYADLQPPAGAPAWYYDGAAVEPPHDVPPMPRTPLPLAAAAYPKAYASGPATPADAPAAATTAAAADTPAEPSRPAEDNATAPPEAVVLHTQLPPLPLQPARPAVTPALATPPAAKPAPAAGPRVETSAPPAVANPGPPAAVPIAPPTPAQMANIAAAAAAAAASASASAAAKVLSQSAPETDAGALTQAAPPAQPIAPKAARADASANPQAPSRAPEDLLRAATERAQQIASQAPVPPPLPPAAAVPPSIPGVAASSPPAPQARASRPPLPPVPPRASVIEEDGPVRGSAPEARVVIRRPDDNPAPPVIRNPGGTPVHLSRQSANRFDGDSYAAYHSEIEEAAVQIVRKTTPPGVPPTRRAVPPLPASLPPQADPAAGARAAAEAAARAAAALNAQSASARPAPPSETARPDPSPAPVLPARERAAPEAEDQGLAMKKGAEKAAVTMGRFLKALTGQ